MLGYNIEEPTQLQLENWSSKTPSKGLKLSGQLFEAKISNLGQSHKIWINSLAAEAFLHAGL